ncbi:MAG TPA: tetratricopeptide repeat protein [Bacillota bacterium]
MKITKSFPRHLFSFLLLWVLACILMKPGWLIFVAGILILAAVTLLFAPEVLWYSAGLLTLNPEKSKFYLEKAVARQPSIPGPYRTLGLIYAKARQWTEAIPLLEKALTLTKGVNLNLNLALAIAYRESGAYEDALSLLHKLIDRGYINVQVYYNLAHTYLKQENLTDALKAAKKARALNATLVEPVLLLGRVHFALQDYAAAKDDFTWAINRLSWPVESYYWLGRCAFAQGEWVEAVKNLEIAVERIKADPLLSDVPVEEAEEWLRRAKAKTDAL